MRRSVLPAALVFTFLSCPLEGLAAPQSTASDSQSSGAPAASETVTEDAVASKLFFAPTGRVLKRGEVYVAIDSLFVGVARVGVTDRFSIGVGKPLFLNTAWITPKLQVYEGQRAAVATGVLHLFAPGFGVGGLGYGVATIGSRDDAITAGMGWFYGKDDDGLRVGVPVLIVGGEHRMGRRSKLITENYLFAGGAVMSVGGRFMRRHVSVEIGGTFILIGSTAAPGVVLNFVFHPAARKKH
jgi:hypothetical protein